MRSPSLAGRWTIAGAAAVWIGALLGLRVGIGVVFIAFAVAVLVVLRSMPAAVLVALITAGALSHIFFTGVWLARKSPP